MIFFPPLDIEWLLHDYLKVDYLSRKLGQIIEQNNTEITGPMAMAMDQSTLPSRKKEEGVTRPSPGSPAILVSCPPQLQVILGNAGVLNRGRSAERGPPGGHHPWWEGLCVIMLFGEYPHSR